MNYESLTQQLKQKRSRVLVTGAAGFIGSHLVERLLKLDQDVIGIDNFSTGHRANVERNASPSYTFHEADICDLDACRRIMEGVDVVLHQAALGSVPRSIKEPQATHSSNVNGFLNVLECAKNAHVKSFVYASSSSVYGDHPNLPKVEAEIGNVLSPYAATKKFNELYADVFFRSYGFSTRGLRYFNVFGPHQDPDGPYAAVIPKWLALMKAGSACTIFGDGETSRDFCFVENAVRANLLAAFSEGTGAKVYNVAVGEQTTLNELHSAIRSLVEKRGLTVSEPDYADFRPGDIRHSLANVSAATSDFGYVPCVRAVDGLAETVDAFWDHV